MPRVEGNEAAQLSEMEKKLDSMEKKLKHVNRRVFSCFNCLIYFLILILAGFIWVAYAVSKSGVVRVPVMSERFFTVPEPDHVVVPSKSADPEKALFDQLKTKSAQQFAQGKEVATVPIYYSEALLTKVLQDYVNKNGKDYEQAQIAVTEAGLELFLHKADSNAYITALVIPTVKDGKLIFRLESLRLGTLRLPTSVGNILLKWFFAQPLNGLNALIRNFGSIDNISFQDGQMVVTFTVTKNSQAFNAF